MNVFTIGKATQGYANYLKAHFAAPSVAIAYDSRINSRLFAETAAGVFAANGIRVHIYPRLMPTPSLSFAVRDLRSCGGVVIRQATTLPNITAKGLRRGRLPDHDGEPPQPFSRRSTVLIPSRMSILSILPKGSLPASLHIGEDTVERYLAAVSAASLLPESFRAAPPPSYTYNAEQYVT